VNKGLAVVLAGMLMLSAVPSAEARRAPLVDLPYTPLRTPQGGAVTLEQVQAAIIDGARSMGWTVLSREPGHMHLQLQLRTHSVDVAVKYDAGGFDMDYLSSADMDYTSKRDGAYIHPNYNVWTYNLSDTIAASPMLEAGFVPPDPNAPRPPSVLTELKLSGPVQVQRDLAYRRGYYVDDEIRTQCPWNQGYAGMASYFGKGLVKVTREDIASLPGYTLRATVVNLRATHGMAGPKWAVIHVELFDNGKLIGEQELRRVTAMPLKGACESLNKVAGALAEDTVTWLQAGKFEARADALPLKTN